MKRTTLLLFAALTALSLLLSGCPATVPQPNPVVDPDDIPACEKACSRMQELGCLEGEDLPDGTTCVEFCQETTVKGHSLNPQCLEKINSCGEISTRCSQ